MSVADKETTASQADASPARRERLVPNVWDRHPGLGPGLGALIVIGLAWLIRAISISNNYEIFIDEVEYTRVALNLATGKGVMLYGSTFDVHPPAVFAMYALVIKVLGLHGGDLASLILTLRPVSALIGATTCGMVFLIVGRLANWPAGIIAASIAAVDPYEIYFDSRVMLEAPAMLGTSVSILLLVRATHNSGRRSWTLVVLSGLAGGFAICAKEYFGVVLALAILLCVATGWVIERRKAAVAFVITSACFALSESLMIATGGFQPWWNQFGTGIRRFIGTYQITGFNAPTVHVSLLSRVAANASHWAVTYLILGFGGVAAALQVIAVIRLQRSRGHSWRHIWGQLPAPVDRGRILVALWAIAAATYLAYATAFGTIEAQMYYLMLIPALCTLVLWGAQRIPRLSTQWGKVAAAVLVGAALVFDSAVWVSVHRTPDNEYRQLLAWAPTHLPKGTKVSVTEYTAQFLLHNLRLSDWYTIPSIKQHHVQYVLLSTNLVIQGYGLGGLQFEQYLNAHAKIAFEANGPAEGHLILYDVRAITGAR